MQSLEPQTGLKIGLYYPHIHFRDEDWLKASILYWDRLARIVPTGYVPNDSDTVRQLQSEFRFIVNLAPAQDALDSVSAPFINLIQLRGGELVERYRLQVEDGAAFTADGRPVMTEILSPKLHRDLDIALRQSGLAVDRQDSSGLASAFVHPRLLDVYMGALAEAMAVQEQCELTSNRTVDHIAASGLTVERLGQALLDLTPLPLGADEVERTMTLVALRMVVPVGLRDVPVSKLMRVRDEYREELSAYQDFVTELTRPDGPLSNLAELRDSKMLEAQLEAYFERRFAPELERLRRTLRGIGVDTVDSVLSIRLPPKIPLTETLRALGAMGTAGVAGVIAPALIPVVATAAVGLATFKIARSARKRGRQAVERTPTAFLMFAEDELSPTNLFGRLERGMRHFVVG